MIFKIAHICYCGNVIRAKQQLSMLGYKLLFSERVCPMGIMQRHLTTHFEEFDLSLWTRPGGISIELLEFEEYSQNKGLICPLFSAKMPGVVPMIDDAGTFKINKSEYFPTAFLECPAYSKLNSSIDEPLLDSLLLFSPDLGQSILFWNAVGLDSIVHSPMHSIFRLRCAFTHKDYFVHVCESGQMETMLEDVNSPGFHVLGLISNSAGQEHARIASFGMEVTPTEQLTINEKSLTIFYSRSPEGIIVEIISLN